jgi:hypothetical protein
MTSDIRMVAAFIGRLASAPCAMNASVWSIARKMYDGPAETGSVATSAPIAGPERSVMIEAATTKAAAIAMRSARESRKASSGDILFLRHARQREPGHDGAETLTPSVISPRPADRS